MDDHASLIGAIGKQMQHLLTDSGQAVYIYLDDVNKVCNKKFAALLDYNSPAEWAKVKENFPTAFVATKSQTTLINAYKKAMEKAVGSVVNVTWKKKSGSTVNTRVILVPVEFSGHLFALHFVEKS